MYFKINSSFNVYLIICFGICTYVFNIPSCFAADTPKAANGTTPKFQIGIIGGGIGGTATAYFLEQSFKEDATLFLYEPRHIGGRLLTSSKFEHTYEVGGSIIHPQNHYMSNFIKVLGLEKSSHCESKFGIFDGQKYAFIETNWKLLTIAKLLAHYGLDAYWLNKYCKEMLEKFSRIYKQQEEELVAFKTVEELLSSMDPDFPSLVKVSTRSHLESKGFHHLIIDELVTAVIRANYGQSTNAHAFVGSISVAAADPDIWSVAGGNKRVPEGLLEVSDALRLTTRVTKIARMPNSKIRVWSANQEGKEESRDFDAVSIAAPLTKDKSTIQFVNFSQPFDFPGSYERVICTLVQGNLNKATFHLNDVSVRVEEILTDNGSLKYNSVGRQFPVENEDRCSAREEKVYKVFSPNALTKDDLLTLFENYTQVEAIEWLAYPHYLSSDILGRFELSPGLYYNNAIEQAGSAMEMSAIAAKNSALLIAKYLKKDEFLKNTERDEL